MWAEINGERKKVAWLVGLNPPPLLLVTFHTFTVYILFTALWAFVSDSIHSVAPAFEVTALPNVITEIEC